MENRRDFVSPNRGANSAMIPNMGNGSLFNVNLVSKDQNVVPAFEKFLGECEVDEEFFTQSFEVSATL